MNSNERQEFAFPHPAVRLCDDAIMDRSFGLTKREFFAGLVLAGIASRENLHPTHTVTEALKQADGLIAALRGEKIKL